MECGSDMRLYEITEDINQNFQFYDEMKSEQWRDDNDCGIIALAIVCGISYADVKMWLNNGIFAHRAREGTFDEDMKAVLNNHGFRINEMKNEEYFNKFIPESEQWLKLSHINEYPELFNEIKSKKQFWFTNVKGRYPLTHVTAVVNGKIEDYKESGDYIVRKIWDIVSSNKPLPKIDTLTHRFGGNDEIYLNVMRQYNQYVMPEYKINIKKSYDISITAFNNLLKGKEYSWTIQDYETIDGQPHYIYFTRYTDDDIEMMDIKSE